MRVAKYIVMCVCATRSELMVFDDVMRPIPTYMHTTKSGVLVCDIQHGIYIFLNKRLVTANTHFRRARIACKLHLG